MIPIEIELKFRVDPSKLRWLLDAVQSLGFASQGRKYEKTTMFDNTGQLMSKTDGRIRLRTSGDRHELSYKLPLKDDTGIKKEIEYETTVWDADIVMHILNAMEYHETSSYERHRTTLMNDDNSIKVTVDEFPFDIFLEIEGDEQEIQSIAQKLGFEMEHNLTKPCDTLFNERRKARGLSPSYAMTFDGYDKE